MQVKFKTYYNIKIFRETNNKNYKKKAIKNQKIY